MDTVRSMLLPYGSWGAIATTVALFGAAARVAVVPAFVTPMIDDVIGRGNLQALPSVLAVTGILAVVGAASTAVQEGGFVTAAARGSARRRETVYRHLLGTTPGRLSGTSGGVAGRVVADVRELEGYHESGISTLAAEGASLIAILGLMVWRAPLPTLALAIFGALTFVALSVLARRVRHEATRTQEGQERVAADVQEGLRHHAVVRAFGAAHFMMTRFRQANVDTQRATERRGWWAAVQTSTTMVVVFAALAGLVSALAREAALGRMTTGAVVEYLTLMVLLSTPAQLLPRAYALLKRGEAAAHRLSDLTAADAGGEGSHRGALGHGTGPVQGTSLPRASVAIDDAPESHGLSVRDLTVAYREGGPLVLEGVTLALPSRGLVALVGDSGSGKSTLFATLLGFVAPMRGDVRWNGRPADPRATFGWVPQSLDLLRGTVRENVVLGRSVSDEQVWAALKSVAMDDVVRGLATGLDHRLREDGGGLSGGQRQRLAVARALAMAPPVLLLDEPTAALDAEAERTLVATLRERAHERLVIVAVHRDAWVEAADVVVDVAKRRATVRTSRHGRESE